MKTSRIINTHHHGSINVVRLTSDGQYCMTGSNDRTIKLWNPHKNDPSQIIFKTNQTTTTDTSINPLLIKSYDGVHGYSVLDIAISKDKSRFGSCGEDRSCYLWDVMSGNTIR